MISALYIGLAIACLLLLIFFAWRRYLWAGSQTRDESEPPCRYSIRDSFSENSLLNVPHQRGVNWLHDVFGRSAQKFPNLTALHIPSTGKSYTYRQLDGLAERVASAVSPHLTGPDQVVAVAVPQNNAYIVAAHLGVLRAGGAAMFLDVSQPENLVSHMLEDAQPVVVLSLGDIQFANIPMLDLTDLPADLPPRRPPAWLDDPTQRLATIFYTSGTTGLPKGVESAHAGYVNLALTYADYFDLLPGCDATSLTSSMGYDGSISEMYSAWVSGCTVVMLTGDELRSGPELVPILRQAEVTVLFCPPVLLTTLSPSPELDLPYPICRYIVPAGEAFPSALVEPWTRARRQIINTYGPTEASTDTSRQSLRAGKPVTIGSPFANVTYVILEEDGLQPLLRGEVGELCIAGVHVARGYRNLPELTAKKFVVHPKFGRLYRTGDRCRIDPDTQQVHFLGRVDTQLKVRGHRVETQPVEDVLHSQFEEIKSAVLDYQDDELVAFVIAPSVAPEEPVYPSPAPPAWARNVLESLASQLPAPSVPTRIFLVENFVLKSASGKIDREKLPRLSDRKSDRGQKSPQSVHSLAASSSDGKKSAPDLNGNEPDNDEEYAAVLSICNQVFETTIGPDDAFADHGGHSIVIAKLAQRLHAEGWAVPVRALMSERNTARKIAALTQRQSVNHALAVATEPRYRNSTERDEAAASKLSVGQFTTWQVLFLFLLYAPHLACFLVVVAFTEVGEFFMTATLFEFLLSGSAMFALALVVPLVSLLWVWLLKIALYGGRYSTGVTPGIYPKWSKMHFRIWAAGRLQDSVLVPLRTLIRSAPVQSFAMRQLGAGIGANVHCAHDAEISGPLDLLRLEDEVTVQTGAYVHLFTWHGQNLHLGRIEIESRAKIGMRAGIAHGVRVGRGAEIYPCTPIAHDVGAEEMWEGAPARFIGKCTRLRRSQEELGGAKPGLSSEALNIAMQVFLEVALVIAPAALVSWLFLNLLDGTDAAQNYFSETPLAHIVWQSGIYAFVTAWFTLVSSSILGALFLRCTGTSPGLYPTNGFRGALLLYRVKKMNQLQRWWTWTLTGQYLRNLAGLRLERVGASECDVMINLVPDLSSTSSTVFWSNGCLTNMLEYGHDYLKLRQMDMAENTFAGNNCVIEGGHFPSNFLVGVSSPASGIAFRRQMNAETGHPITIVGNPPIEVPPLPAQPEEPPTFQLFLGRVLLGDIFSIGFLPIANVLAYVLAFTVLLRADIHPLTAAVLALLLAEFALVLSSVGVKKLFVGNRWGRDDMTPFWSWRHFTYFFAQDCFYAWCRIPLGMLSGTVLSNVVLRAMGCQIGERTILTSPMQAADWNATSFGDDCVVSGFLQYHTMEDMMLKVKRTSIADKCSVNFGATVMGGANIEPDVDLQPLSMVLKEMYLASATYEGSPVEPAPSAPELHSASGKEVEVRSVV